MLADFYIPRLSNDMKSAVQKNHLRAQILYRILDPSKKTGVYILFCLYFPKKVGICFANFPETTQETAPLCGSISCDDFGPFSWPSCLVRGIRTYDLELHPCR